MDGNRTRDGMGRGVREAERVEVTAGRRRTLQRARMAAVKDVRAKRRPGGTLWLMDD